MSLASRLSVEEIKLLLAVRAKRRERAELFIERAREFGDPTLDRPLEVLQLLLQFWDRLPLNPIEKLDEQLPILDFKIHNLMDAILTHLGSKPTIM